MKIANRDLRNSVEIDRKGNSFSCSRPPEEIAKEGRSPRSRDCGERDLEWRVWLLWGEGGGVERGIDLAEGFEGEG